MLKTKLENLKDAVREWVSLISIHEIMFNEEIAKIFESIEHKIQVIEESYV